MKMANSNPGKTHIVRTLRRYLLPLVTIGPQPLQLALKLRDTHLQAVIPADLRHPGRRQAMLRRDRLHRPPRRTLLHDQTIPGSE
jgi:hypothetical protein